MQARPDSRQTRSRMLGRRQRTGSPTRPPADQRGDIWGMRAFAVRRDSSISARRSPQRSRSSSRTGVKTKSWRAGSPATWEWATKCYGRGSGRRTSTGASLRGRPSSDRQRITELAKENRGLGLSSFRDHVRGCIGCHSAGEGTRAARRTHALPSAASQSPRSPPDATTAAPQRHDECVARGVTFPHLRQTVVDCESARQLTEFYSRL